MLSKRTITEILSRRFKEILNEPLSGQMTRRLTDLQVEILTDIERAPDEKPATDKPETGSSSSADKGARSKPATDQNKGGAQ